MRLIHSEKEWKVVFYLKEAVLKGQCDNLYDCGLIRHLRLSYKGQRATYDDDMVDRVCIVLSPTTNPKTITKLIHYARLTLYHSE